MPTFGMALAAILSIAIQSPAFSAAAAPRDAWSLRVHIALSHSGMGLRGPSNLTQHIDIVVRDGVARRGSTMVPLALVQRLLLSIRAPRVDAPTAQGLGMTQAWLRVEASTALAKYQSSYSPAPTYSKRQQLVFIRHFCDAGIVAKWIDAHYGLSDTRTMTSDDYPHVRVGVRWANGRSITIDSTAQSQFMLPWHIGPGKQQTYNAAISKAVAALVPRSPLNANRLAGRDLALTYASYIVDRY